MSGIAGGAAQGAQMGSVGGPWGMAAGAVAGGIAGHFMGKHSSSKTDRAQYLQGQGELNNIFNYGIGEGKSATSEAKKYNSDILSGNRATISQAMAPEVSAVTGQAAQAKRQEESMGTSRGGGTAAGNQQRQQQTQGAVSNLIAKARPEAAAAQQNLGGNLLGLGENAASAYTGNAAGAHKESEATNESQGQAAGKLAASHAFGF